VDPLDKLHRILFHLFMHVVHGSSGVNAVAAADEDAKPALSGTWKQKDGQQEIEFTDKDHLTISAHQGDLLIRCRYKVEKEGGVKVEIAELDGKDELKEKAKDKLPVGFEFRFKWKARSETATLDDVMGEKAELLKSHLEGDYERKK